MNKSQLIEKVAQKTNSPKNLTESYVSAILETISECLLAGEEVKLIGFVTFSVTQRKEKTGRNIKTGEEVTIPATQVAKFKPGKELKEKLQKKKRAGR
ncbi:MAG: HU family DNA-binding protein [Bdellovibrionia bacterium]